MGEYATRKSDGERVKIGTCESMYYLRADQRQQVAAEPNSVDVNSKDALSIRFRFPWPDEDHVLPGEFDPYDRAIAVPGAVAPTNVEHYSVQFTAHAGYVTSLPCPESGATIEAMNRDGTGLPVTMHRNGFPGAVHLFEQKLLADGRLVPVCRCGGCGSMWRMEDPAEIQALAVAFRAEADDRERSGRHNGTGAADRRFWDQVADRILAGAILDGEELADALGYDLHPEGDA